MTFDPNKFVYVDIVLQFRIESVTGNFIPLGVIVTKQFADDINAKFLKQEQERGYTPPPYTPPPYTPPAPPSTPYEPKKTLAARVPSFGNSVYVQLYLRRLRDRWLKRWHEKLHPLI